MDKDEFVYCARDCTQRGRKYARLRERFYDWFQEHKYDEKPKKNDTIARKFGVSVYTVRYWINKLGGYAEVKENNDSIPHARDL